ncbi:SEC-C motif-containing protein [Acidaminobacter hydrogenoformans DSM 2784]|uniref:SEC-C motif-containing protein n=1 Tax=Acidaminobacter hydrogenoformans DSM 2784 TaxID=1120920 RepID=A0A1G5S7G4_9FIRM|nr:SEC-C metal-binding domain-containing protein [Acidaminobacter hydrogenoformans]SCZ82057.1 SEC-C motif-containing protein [Acidaminobacter hydrogenoformans DSM 2784]
MNEYIIALTNLYGMVHRDKVVEIYNIQNKDQISSQDLDVYFTESSEKLENHFIETYQDYFVHKTVMEFDEFDLMLRKKADKPYFVPKKEELLKYVDERYYERTLQYNALLSYVKKKFSFDNEEKAEWLCDDIHGICQFGADMDAIFDSFNVSGIIFKDTTQINEVMKLVMELANNIRIWENNGHTPHEISSKYEKASLRPMSNQPFESVVKKEKIGRNDPCPCGSGKKYKKCCMGKEELS